MNYVRNELGHLRDSILCGGVLDWFVDVRVCGAGGNLVGPFRSTTYHAVRLCCWLVLGVCSDAIDGYW